MSDVLTDIGVMHPGSGIKASALNTADKILLTNQSGGDAAVTGDVLMLDIAHDEAFTFASATYPTRPAFVVPSDIDAAGAAGAKSIAVGDLGWVFRPGAYVPLATVAAAVSIGEYLAFSSTSKKFAGTGIIANDTNIRPLAAKAIALEAAAGAGQIKVWLLPYHGYTTRYARVYNDAAIALTAADLTLMTFNTEDYDDYGFHEGVTNPGRLTVPADFPGTAKFEIGGYLSSSAALAAAYIIIRLNGAEIIAKKNPMAAVIDAGMFISAQYKLSAGDYVELLVYTTTAGQTIQANAYSPIFSITQVGEAYFG